MTDKVETVRGGIRRLVIDARRGTVGAVEGGRRLLGLTLLERLVLAARRVGIVDIVVVASNPDHARLRSAVDILPASAFVDALPVEPCALPTILVPADVLGETAWLAALMRLPIDRGEIREADGVRLLGRGVVPADTTAAPGVGGLALDVRPLRLRRPEDLAAAEKRLLEGLRKQTDGFMARVVARPLSIAVSRRLVSLGVSPNQMTLVSMSIGLAAAFFFLSPNPVWQLIGSLLFVAHSVLDGCDGELARLTFRESRLGGLLDFVGDNIVHVAVFACMAIGWSLEADAAWPLLFGLGALIGTIGSASAVYWLTLRHKTGGGPLYTSTTGDTDALSRLLDELSRRDFIYLVPLFAAVGKAQWFVALSGIGAPMFLLVLLVTATRERRERSSAR